MKRLKKIPKFKDEDAEREFWSKADSAEYIDWGKARHAIFPHLKPGQTNMRKKISVRMPLELKRQWKKAAAARKISMSQFATVAVTDYLIKISSDPTLRKLLKKG